MCFSAEASFVAGTVLLGVGVATIKKSQTKFQLLFSSIPLLFGIQQIAEGFLWLSLLNNNFISFKVPSTYIFLSFAQVLWPTWVPLSILLIEKDKKFIKTLSVLLFIGILVSTFLTYRLYSGTTSAEIVGYHISYNIEISNSSILILSPLYFIATVVPAFFSSIKRMWFLGFLILSSYIITKIFFENYVISVWCFLGAIISISVYFIISNAYSVSHKEIITPLK